ncbi:hypothetical protein N7509_005329 [Penicillium cosmopolitanum]|uniref:Uncharacterized protein n=1 Tax=Penicillium cosmopolitanum TaxID=1131564 RepID=A0A9X0B9X9_9EURO|nr:uncharacterized protein N7509_005329 [Penicillium cosmopolitanum]KAJ5397216.1 hypothetical protein N7509_005329 [Penicillium cosmopolitanum]
MRRLLDGKAVNMAGILVGVEADVASIPAGDMDAAPWGHPESSAVNLFVEELEDVLDSLHQLLLEVDAFPQTMVAVQVTGVGERPRSGSSG